MIKIAPSILAADFSCLGSQVAVVEAGGAAYLHIDVMDGHFVPNITVGPLVLKALRQKSRLLFDTHLMINEPDRYLADFAQAGAGLITVHQEACPHLHRTVTRIKELGVRTGVAINPGTPWQTLECVLPLLDLVLVMTVNPGFGGQQFIPLTIAKIKALADLRQQRGLAYEIEVDGGINRQTAPLVVAAGADVLVAGSAVFGAADITGEVAFLRRLSPD